MCPTLKKYDHFFGNVSVCKDWPENFFDKYDEPNNTLVDELYKYGRNNLALVHVMIQSPYVTKIKRDLEMTFTNFVANTGGLLGLCLGFSFISGIEILFWCCCFCQSYKKQDQRNLWSQARCKKPLSSKTLIKKITDQGSQITNLRSLIADH